MSMEQLSELEKFLHSQSAEGSQQGGGSFTLAREKALLKLANFQLPFAGAWAVKLVQAAVSAGAQVAFSATLGKRVATFSFDGNDKWEIEQVEEAFFNPEPTKIRHLRHLLSALWQVGVAEKRAFQLSLPGSEVDLVWNGSTLSRVPMGRQADKVELVVTHAEAGKNLLSEVLTGAKRNQEIAEALKDYCFTCPIPLLVDARRFDALQHCPEYGWNESSFPIAISFLQEEDAPQLKVPSGTFLDHKEFQNSELMDGAGLETITKKMMKAVEPVEYCTGAALISVNAGLHSQGESSGYLWKLRQRSSKCFWIQDGVAAQIQTFPTEPSAVSVACFLPAHDLENDLSGFYIADQRTRNRRLEKMGVLLRETVSSLESVSGKEIKKHNKSRYQKLGNATLFLGIGIGHYITWGIGALLVSFGVFARFAERAEEKKLLQSLERELHLFVKNWLKIYKAKKQKTP